MCVAIYSPIGVNIPKESYLRNSFLNNPDGAGFAFNLNNHVVIRKGFMEFDDFYKAIHEADKQYDLAKRGVLIHFRIATHGGVNPGLCHPFPISGSEKQLKASETNCSYAIVHNGIINLFADEARRFKDMSDTAIFVKNVLLPLSKNKKWFTNKANIDLIESTAKSKIAILDGQGRINSTSGFIKDDDGNYYSNASYKSYEPIPKLPFEPYRYLLDYGREDKKSKENANNRPINYNEDYLEMLKEIAFYQGFDREDIDSMLEAGYTLEEIEDLLYEY